MRWPSRLAHWASVATERIQNDGQAGVWWALISLYYALLIKRFPTDHFDRRGDPIYRKDWDVLIVLDACRADLMGEVADEYDYVNTETTYSVASTSAEWMYRNFGPGYSDEMQETVHVTGNPFSNVALSSDQFLVLDEVWQYAWDEDIGTVHPRAITDRAITHGRDVDWDRMILHYMQPHFPSVPNPELGAGMDRNCSKWEGSVWRLLRAGETTESEVWEAYRANLRYVLDDLRIVLDNLDADRIVITSDHGNAIGDFGFYGHPDGILLRCLREVPWCVTTATDSGEYVPQSYETTGDKDASVKERLADLGYV